MKNRDPRKLHILKDASSDMLAEPPLFASLSRQNIMFLHVFSGTAPRLHFSCFYQKSVICGHFWFPFWHLMRLKIDPTSIPKKHKKNVGEIVMRKILQVSASLRETGVPSLTTIHPSSPWV